MERPVEKIWLVYGPKLPSHMPRPTLVVVANSKSEARSYYDVPELAVAEEIDYENIFIDISRDKFLRPGIVAELNLNLDGVNECNPKLTATQRCIADLPECEYGLPFHNSAVL